VKAGNDLKDGMNPRDDSWLSRPSTIRLLWWIFAAVLAASVAVQLLFKVKGYFGIDGWLGFGAVFGFLSCVAMVLVAKVLGWFLKRDEHYYREPGDD
jgi:sterol desaturase/sphingolipid hydroxylase (fatty acid hydroxylase superfamily)